MEERKNVYLSLHKSFVREGIEYTDRATGEARTFNSATLPKGTVVDGVDVGGYEFSPMFVNESRFKGRLPGHTAAREPRGVAEEDGDGPGRPARARRGRPRGQGHREGHAGAAQGGR